VVTTSKRPATYEDLLKVPDNLVAEIVEGELYTSPRPAGPHERAAGGIHSRLRFSFDDGDGPGGWWIAIEPELHLGGDILVPDVGGWRRERVPSYPIGGAAAEVRPDWICEVVSPSTGRFDRMRKLPAYARHGVAYAWIVDPLQRTIEAFRLQGERWLLIAVYGGDEPAHIEPFDAIEIPLSTLWLPQSPAA
jgi:Uma2 family endonuclease